MTRDEFLLSWKSYPRTPKNAEACGRIQSVSATEVILKNKSFAHKDSRWQVFKSGDIVALVQNQIFLLAPAMIENPISSDKGTILKSWSQFQEKTRQYFNSNKFLEIQTPTLVQNPGTEPTLDVFETQFSAGRRQQKLFLPTSPELHLKKALAMDFDLIYEIRHCFRNGEVSRTHQPEFVMLEWYRAYADLHSIKKDVQGLLELHCGEQLAFSTVSMAELFRLHLQFELKPSTTKEDLIPLAQKVGYQTAPMDTFDDLFYGIFVAQIEARIDSTNPVFVEKYPPSQAALARLTEDGWGDRFELYWKGFEIANAFNELNDPVEQRKRMLADLAEKKRLGKTQLPIEESFLLSLHQGMPPAAGIALGLERLFMAIHEISDIRELRLFPISD